MKLWRGCTFILVIAMTSGCGYTLRGQERPFFERKEIRTLYIQPVKNDSYKAGTEIMVYNVIRKRFSQWGYVKIVDNPDQADAKLYGVVTNASYEPGAPTTVSNLSGTINGGKGPSNVYVASTYNVTLGISFELTSAKKGSLWKEGISRSKSFQASTYYGSLGSTSALINESQFEDTLAILATSVINDAEESMNAMF